MSPTTLDTLPVEIRLCIWRFLLGHEYNSKPDFPTPAHRLPWAPGDLRRPSSIRRGKLHHPANCLNFPTAIFRVNRSLGYETRMYFHEHNFFVDVTSHNPAPVGYGRGIPRRIVNKHDIVNDAAFEIHLRVGNMSSAHPVFSSTSRTMICGAHMEQFTLTRLLSYRAWTESRRARTIRPFFMAIAKGRGLYTESSAMRDRTEVLLRKFHHLIHIHCQEDLQIMSTIRLYNNTRPDLFNCTLLAAVAGKVHRQHIDQLLRDGFSAHASNEYHDLLKFSSEVTKLGGFGISRKADMPRCIIHGFFTSDLVDCEINQQLAIFLVPTSTPDRVSLERGLYSRSAGSLRIYLSRLQGLKWLT